MTNTDLESILNNINNKKGKTFGKINIDNYNYSYFMLEKIYENIYRVFLFNRSLKDISSASDINCFYMIKKYEKFISIVDFLPGDPHLYTIPQYRNKSNIIKEFSEKIYPHWIKNFHFKKCVYHHITFRNKYLAIKMNKYLKLAELAPLNDNRFHYIIFNEKQEFNKIQEENINFEFWNHIYKNKLPITIFEFYLNYSTKEQFPEELKVMFNLNDDNGQDDFEDYLSEFEVALYNNSYEYIDISLDDYLLSDKEDGYLYFNVKNENMKLYNEKDSNIKKLLKTIKKNNGDKIKIRYLRKILSNLTNKYINKNLLVKICSDEKFIMKYLTHTVIKKQKVEGVIDIDNIEVYIDYDKIVDLYKNKNRIEKDISLKEEISSIIEELKNENEDVEWIDIKYLKSRIWFSSKLKGGDDIILKNLFNLFEIIKLKPLLTNNEIESKDMFLYNIHSLYNIKK